MFASLLELHFHLNSLDSCLHPSILSATFNAIMKHLIMTGKNLLPFLVNQFTSNKAKKMQLHDCCMLIETLQ